MKFIKYIIRKVRENYFFYRYGGVAFAKYMGVTVGENCRIFSQKLGSEPFLIKMGNHVTVTSGVIFLTHDGSAWLMRDDKGRRYLYRRIEIGSHVFIGINSIIMPGVKISDYVIIAPGSVITKSIPPNVIVAGVPAKIIGKYSDLEEKILTSYISEKDFDKNIGYKEYILKITDNTFKPFLTE